MKVINKLRENLLAGDLFEDGGRVFIIDEVYANGRYKSHVVEKSFLNSEETSDVLSEISADSKDDLINEISAPKLEDEEQPENEEDENNSDVRRKKNKLEKLTREELIKIAFEQGKDSKGLKKQEIISLILG